MKPIFLTLFAVLFSYSSSSGFEINQNGNRIETNQSDKVPPSIIDLNVDVIYIILQQMELHQLINTAEAIPQLSDLIENVFRWKYLKDKPLTKIFIYKHGIGGPVKIVDNTIHIIDSENCIKMLKRFGHFLQNVIIHYYETTGTHDVINRALNQYCSSSLKQLQWNFNCRVSTGVKALDIMTPFNGVEEFSIDIGPNKLKLFKPLFELFPNLRRLNVKLDSDGNISFIDGHFPYLSHFHLNIQRSFEGYEKEQMTEQIKGMIMKNPTIRSIEWLHHDRQNFLKFLNEALPNLEHLKVDCVSIDNSVDTIQFENVKSFVTEFGYACYANGLNKLSFPHLESLEIREFPDGSLDRWIPFFRRHTQLTRLYVKFGQINELVANLPNLMDFTAEVNRFYNIETIARFIQSNGQLEKINFIFGGNSITTDDVIPLKQQFQNKWTIKAIEGIQRDNAIKSISFERI